MIEMCDTSTPDGIIRNSEVNRDTLPGGPWDGTIYSYIPSPELRIDPSVQLHDEFDIEIDPITYQVLRSRFWNMNLDHSDTVKRVSGSPVIVYTEDFNTSLLTENGDTVLCGPSIQYFTGYGDLVVKWTLENRSGNPGIEDGDIYLQNDPYIGTAHQIDVELYAPVFWDGRLFCWVFSNCHVGDIGGINPGSFVPEAPDIFSEPIPMPPLRLARNDEVQQDIFEMVVRQSHTPATLTLQLRSQIAGLRATKARMRELLEEYGAQTIKGAMRRIIRDCSRVVSERLRQIPDGEWREDMYIGAAGPTDRSIHRLVTTVRKEGDRMIFANAGTDPQFQAANGTYGSWRSALICAAGTMLAYDQMYCPAGVIDHMQFNPTPGTLTCATYPGAVTTLASTIISVYLSSQVISKMVLAGPPEIRKVANATGGVALPGWWVASGFDRKGKFVADVTADQVMGAIGAFPYRDGVDTGGAWWWPRSTAGNAEEWENSVPFLYLYRREQRSSGGPGRWRGGNGVEVGFVPHKSNSLHAQVVSVDPGVVSTLGLMGGYPGHPGNFLTASDTRIWEVFADGRMPGTRDEVEAQLKPLHRVSPKAALPLRGGDIWVVENSAGGGFGDPLLREPRLVLQDVIDRRIDRTNARTMYGVLITDTEAVDEVATEALRRNMRQDRLASADAPHKTIFASGKVAPHLIRKLTETVGLAALADGTAWTCAQCDAALGPADDNYKLYAAMRERNPHEVDPVMYANPTDFCDDPLVLREFFCPSCAHLLSTEIARARDPVFCDMKIEVEPHQASRSQAASAA
jgi:N-methylhydantoinase B